MRDPIGWSRRPRGNLRVRRAAMRSNETGKQSATELSFAQLSCNVTRMSSESNQKKSRNRSACGSRDWTVHPGSHEIVPASGARVRLEARAMHVLQLLYERAGDVVTTEQMLARVWEHKVVTPHSVATVISELARRWSRTADGSRRSRSAAID